MAQDTNGEMWLNPTTETTRFKVNNKKRTLIPEPFYVAAATLGTPIIAGTPLGLESGTGKVVALDPSSQIKCIGIANNTATAGQDVEVITTGKYEIPISLFQSSSPILNVLDASDKGEIVYASSETGKYTLSRETAVLGSRNVIEIGILTDFNSGISFTIQIQLNGDGRGPVGITEVEYELADPQMLSNQLLTYAPRVYAIGSEGTGNAFSQTFRFYDNLTLSNISNEFIIFYTGLKAIGFYFTINSSGAAVPSALNTKLNQLVPSAYREIYEVAYTGSTFVATTASYSSGDPTSYLSSTNGGPLTSSFLKSFLDIILTISKNKNLLGLSSTSSLALKDGFVTINDALNAVDLTLTGTTNSPINTYISGANLDLNGFIDKNNTYITQIGNSVNSGKAILADNRFISNSNLIGFMVNDSSQDPLLAGSKGLFKKFGQVDGFTGLTAGAPVFLGQNGEVTQSTSLYVGLNTIQVGLALSSTTIDVNLLNILESPELSFPTGAVIKLATGITTADYGYRLCNGDTISKVSNTEYTEVVDYINKINGSSGDTATLPNLNSGGNYYQIKVLRLGGTPKYPSAFQYSISKTKSEIAALTGSWTIDYTTSLGSLVDFQSANLSKIMLKFFLKNAAGTSMVELQPGIFTGGSSPTTYGFTVTDAFVDSPRAYKVKLDFYGAGTPVFGYVSSAGTFTPAASTDILVVQAYRAENYEYFAGPELISLRQSAHSHTNLPYLETINQNMHTDSNVIFPQLTGGAATDSTLTLRSTSASGTTDAIVFKTGNSAEAMRILNAGNVTFTGSIGVTGTRISKGWFTDLEITNLPSINGTAITTTATRLNYLTSAAGTTGTASTNIVFSTSPTITTPTILTSITPSTHDGSSLGTSALGWSDIYLGTGGVITWGAASTPNVTLTHSTGVLTLGGTLALGANSITMTGSLGATGARVTKGWFTDLEITNLPSINGTAITTTATKLNYLTSATGTTGTASTNIVFSTSPTLVTPTLGVATATSINKMSITAPATGSTLAVADGKTLTSSNTLTFTGTDGSTLNIGSGGTLGTGAYATIANYAALSGASFTGQVTIAATGTSAGGLTLPSTRGLGNIWIGA